MAFLSTSFVAASLPNADYVNVQSQKVATPINALMQQHAFRALRQHTRPHARITKQRR